MEPSLQHRIDDLVGKWPISLARDFYHYLGDSNDEKYSLKVSKNQDSNYPYWVLLPDWLSSVYSKHLKVSRGWLSFLSQIYWAQYCLFLFLRIQDDLFDGDVDQISLMFVTDQLLLEADQTLSKYFDRKSRFWRIYRGRILKATQSLVNLDELQQRPDTQPQRLMESYAEVSSILQIASIAVCFQANRFEDIPRVITFADAMAIAGQIVDDLQDLEEDLKRGRFNFAAIRLIGYQRKQSRKETLKKLIARGIFIRGGATTIISEIYKQIGMAERALEPLRIKEANDYLRNYEKSISEIENVIHRLRVRYFFGY